MIIYHTCASARDVETARDHAPSHEHGFGWLPEKMCRHEGRYFVDNGCFGARHPGDHWQPSTFYNRLDRVEEMPRPPDFVVMPDHPGDHAVTVERSMYHLLALRWYGYPLHFAIQPGASIYHAVERARRWDCTGVFLGGPASFKREIVDEVVDRAHDVGLRVHVGRPGSLVWAFEAGVDSVDTSSIVRNKSWHRLDRLERMTRGGTRQATLIDAVG